MMLTKRASRILIHQIKSNSMSLNNIIISRIGNKMSYATNICNLSSDNIMNGTKNPPIIKTSDENAVDVGSRLIQSGSVIALPTDTIYGLACDATNSKAIKQIYEIKKRDFKNRIAICVSEIHEISKWAKTDHVNNELLHCLLPGPVTIVIDRNQDTLNQDLNPDSKTIAIRIPENDFLRQVVSRSQVPIALTSANTSNDPSCTDINEFDHLWPSLAAIFDSGKITNQDKLGSTIVDLTEKDCFKILRNGIASERVEHILSSKFNLINKSKD